MQVSRQESNTRLCVVFILERRVMQDEVLDRILEPDEDDPSGAAVRAVVSFPWEIQLT